MFATGMAEEEIRAAPVCGGREWDGGQGGWRKGCQPGQEDLNSEAGEWKMTWLCLSMAKPFTMLHSWSPGRV